MLSWQALAPFVRFPDEGGDGVFLDHPERTRISDALAPRNAAGLSIKFERKSVPMVRSHTMIPFWIMNLGLGGRLKIEPGKTGATQVFSLASGEDHHTALPASRSVRGRSWYSPKAPPNTSFASS